MLRTLIRTTTFALLGIGVAHAQNAAAPTVPVVRPDAQDAAIARHALELTKRAMSAAQNAASTGASPGAAAARATGIPKSALLSAREKHLKALGISDTVGRLYIFVSPTTMPKAMIRAYARDAVWTGAILVVRGLPPHTTLSQFVKKTLVPYAKAGITLQIDPRLYNAFNVTAVPALVYTTALSASLCRTQIPMKGKIDGKTYAYDACGQVSPNSYWKVSGAVTTLWSLEQFAAQGANVAPMIAALKTQTPYRKTLHGISRRVFAETISHQSTGVLIGQYLRSGKLPGAQMLPLKGNDQGGAQ